jgi:hypothetical protein
MIIMERSKQVLGSLTNSTYRRLPGPLLPHACVLLVRARTRIVLRGRGACVLRGTVSLLSRVSLDEKNFACRNT